MARLVVDGRNIGDSTIVITDKNDISHLTKVCRLGIGKKVTISDGASFEYQCEIIEIGSQEVICKILDKQDFAGEPKTWVTLFQGVPKSSKMELIIQKTVELGVKEIVPVFMDRSVVQEGKGTSKKVERWQKISQEAVKQCKRGIVPEVRNPIKSKDFEEALKDFDIILMPYEEESEMTMKDVLADVKEKWQGIFQGTAKGNIQELTSQPKIALIIGPEGGFSRSEWERISKLGGKSLTLGKTTLRTETAPIAALAMVMYELEL